MYNVLSNEGNKAEVEGFGLTSPEKFLVNMFVLRDLRHPHYLISIFLSLLGRGFVTSRFCSIHFTITLAGLENNYRSLYRGLRYCQRVGRAKTRG